MNPVYDFLKAHPQGKYSVSTIAKRLNMKRRPVMRLCMNTETIRKVHPQEVGWGSVARLSTASGGRIFQAI